MQAMQRTQAMHPLYLGVLRQLADQIDFCCNQSSKRSPLCPRDLEQCALIVLRHLANLSYCPDCNGFQGLEHAEAVFFEIHAVCHRFVEYQSALGKLITRVCSDGGDEKLVHDPLSLIAAFLAEKRYLGIMVKNMRKSERYPTSSPHRPSSPHRSIVDVVSLQLTANRN